jgi:hypothetical protein
LKRCPSRLAQHSEDWWCFDESDASPTRLALESMTKWLQDDIPKIFLLFWRR